MGPARWWWPREYGAYAELLFPLLTGFILGGATSAGLGFAVAAASGLLVNQPLSVLKGLRGSRLRQEAEQPARRSVAALVLVGSAGAVWGMVSAPPVARLAALLPGLLAAALAPSMLWGKPKTMANELLMAAALAFMTPPVMLAGHPDPGRAAAASAAWFACFCLATLAVHAVKARAKPRLGTPWALWASPVSSSLVVVAAVVGVGNGGLVSRAALAAAPAALVALAAWGLRVHPLHLKRIGWALVAGNVVTLLLLLRE